MKNNLLLLEDLRRINFVMNYDSKKTYCENFIEPLLSEEKIKNLLNEAASTTIMNDLKSKIQPRLGGTLKLRNNSKYPTAIDIYGYSNGRYLTFFNNGTVKWFDGKKYTNGGKWDFNMTKGGKLAGGWLKDDKGANVSLDNAINYPAKHYGTGASALPQKTSWDRLEGGDNGYWIGLFDRLTAAGSNPKWGDNGKQVTDGKKATFIYSGPWIIWKDLNKNNGFPITTKRKNLNFSAKWNGGKYAGGTLDKTTIAVYDSATKKLVQTTLFDFVGGTDEAFINKVAKGGAQKQKEVADNALATQIANEIDAAFDLDDDGVHNDYDGTSENKAVAVFNKIKDKSVLDKVNKIIKGWGYYNSSIEWLEDEMSDSDYTEYRAIWARLEKLGYKAPAVNPMYLAAGVAADVTGVKAADRAIDSIRSLSTEEIMEGFREIVGGVGGTIAQIILSFTGPIGAGVNVLINGVLLAWDVIQWVNNSDKFSFFNLIFDLFTVALSAIGLGQSVKSLNVAKSAVAAEKTAGGFFTKLAAKFPELSKWVSGIIGKVSSVGKTVVSNVSKGISWLVSKFTFLKSVGNTLSGALSKIGTVLDEITKAVGKTTAGKTAKTVLNYSVQSLTKMGSSYLAKWGRVQSKIMLQKAIAAMETKLAGNIFKELDKKALDAIKNYIAGTAGDLTVDATRPAVCSLGQNYCTTYDILATSASVAYDVKGLPQGIKDTKKAASEIKTAKDKLEKVEKTIKTAEKGAKQYKTAYKGTEKEIKGVEGAVGTTTTKKV